MKLFSKIVLFLPPFTFFSGLLETLTDEIGQLTIPAYARQAVKIEEWSDVERLEKEFMSSEPEDGILHKAFIVNKQKLHEIMNKLEQLKVLEKDSQQKLTASYSIQPSHTLGIPFQVKAPLVYRKKDYLAQFAISYCNHEGDSPSTFSSTETISFNASSSVISAGVLTGAISGYLVKITLMTPQAWFTTQFWGGLVGASLLALIMAFLTVKTPDSDKPVTAENFIGGFIIGGITAMFSETIIEKLRTLLGSDATQA